jgi:hypothetical protein
MTENGNNNKGLAEYVRLVTPILIFVFGIVLTVTGNSITMNIDDMKERIQNIGTSVNNHLQNAELHIPRASIVSRDEWILYQSMRDKQNADIKDSICELRDLLKRHMGLR